MSKSLGHGSSEHRVVLQADEKFVACTACRDISCDFRSYHSQFNPFRTMVGTAKENESEGGSTDGGVFGIFMCVKESLQEGSQHSKGCNEGPAATDLLYDQPSQAMAEEDYL
jgi:hypothetical protein